MDEEDGLERARVLHVLMAGGGTAGHVFPALAVATDLLERGHRVSWMGRSGGMEESLVAGAGLPFEALDARPWVGKSPWAKVRSAATLVASSWRARGRIAKAEVDVVLGTGGYVSIPGVLGARLSRRPALVLEPNARAGAANRLASRFCRAAFVAHRETAAELRCPCEVTGIPVRGAFHEVGGLVAGSAHLLILGGSQGALEINRLMPKVLRSLTSASGLEGLTVTHQTGRAHIESVRAAYADLGLTGGDKAPEVVPFIEDMAQEMEKAHLVVSRAGALATAELAAAGRPSILIPLIGAGAGHQRDNALQMEEAGAAVALEGGAVAAEELSSRIEELLTNRDRLMAMAQSARALAQPDSAAAIATEIERVGGRS